MANTLDLLKEPTNPTGSNSPVTGESERSTPVTTIDPRDQELFRELVNEVLGRTRFQSEIEDVLQDMELKKLRNHPNTMPGKRAILKRRIWQTAKKFRLGIGTFGELPQVKSQLLTSEDVDQGLPARYPWLCKEFSHKDIDNMLNLMREGGITQSRLAAGCGIGERALRYRAKRCIK